MLSVEWGAERELEGEEEREVSCAWLFSQVSGKEEFGVSAETEGSSPLSFRGSLLKDVIRLGELKVQFPKIIKKRQKFCFLKSPHFPSTPLSEVSFKTRRKKMLLENDNYIVLHPLGCMCYVHLNNEVRKVDRLISPL